MQTQRFVFLESNEEKKAMVNKKLEEMHVRIELIRDKGGTYNPALCSPEDVVELLGEEARSWDREHFLSIALNTKNRVLGIDTVTIGTLREALVHPREVMKSLILANAHAFICLHNHPSGDPAPSGEDIAVTRRLNEAGKLLGINLLDHVIVGAPEHYSLQENGLM